MINYDGYGFVLCMMCPTSFPSPTQLHLTPSYPTTCTATSPGTPSNTTTIPHHTTPHQGSDTNNTSTIRARGGARMFAWGGGGGQNCQNVSLYTAARAIHFCTSPEKVAQRVCVCVGGGGGGTRHNGVGVLGHDRLVS